MYMNVIYKIEINDKYYIGSSVNYTKRKNDHLRKLRLQTHHNILLQNLYNKYGDNTIKFTILENVEDRNDLIKTEQKYLDEHCDNDNCVNLAKMAGGGAVYKLTKESIQKGIETKRRKGSLSNRYIPYRFPKEMIESRRGKHHTEETKKRISETNKEYYKNNPIKQETCKQNGKAFMEKRWADYNKPFNLIKNDTKYGPYKTIKEAATQGILSYYQISQLFHKRKSILHGVMIELLFDH